MISRLFIGRFRGDLSPAAAAAHWRDEHAPLGARLPGLLRYLQYHPADDGAASVISLLEFADRAAMEHAFGLDGSRTEALAAANADEANFIEPGPTGGIVGERHTLGGATSLLMGPGAVVVVAPGGCDVVDLPPGATTHESIVATPPPLPWDTITWPRVDLIGFDTIAAARSIGNLPGNAITVPHVVVDLAR